MSTATITFDRFESVPAGDDAEQWIRINGEIAGTITREYGATSRIYKTYAIKVYGVEIEIDGTSYSHSFWVEEHGSARKAHNAAKAWAKGLVS